MPWRRQVHRALLETDLNVDPVGPDVEAVGPARLRSLNALASSCHWVVSLPIIAGDNPARC